MTRAARRIGGRTLLGALAAGSLLALAGPSGAVTPAEPDRIPALGRSVAGTDDTTALVLNPANLAFLPAAELRWQGVYLGDARTAPWQGHAVSLGFPLPFSMSTALRGDFVAPPRNAFGGHSSTYQWLTWGLAFKGSDSFGVGFSLQRSYSSGIVAGGLGSYSLGLSTRPIPALGFSLVGNHVNGPLDGRNAERLAALGAPNASLGASVTPALAIRPLGTRALEVGLEARRAVEPGVWIPRATLGVDIPRVGRLRGDFALYDPEASKPAWQAAASLSVYLNAQDGSSELELGGVTGTARGEPGTYDWFNGIAFRGFREPTGTVPPRTAVRLRLESTPGTREHVALLRKLWRLSEDEDVAAVVLELRTSPAESLAHVQELRDAVRLLRVRGKRVLCHLEDANGGALYLCAAADRILVNPAGGLRFAGLKTRHIYVADLLGKLGIQADFVRIGAHKSAPEQFTRGSATDVARADSIDLLQQNERWFVGDIAADRRIAVNELRARIARGPFVADEAKAAGLVDDTAFDDEIENATRALTGEEVSLSDADRADVAPEVFGKQRSVAMVYVDGDIVDGRSRNIPLVGLDLVGSYTIAETLKKVRENPLVGAVVLRIESPGGSSMASDVMWREVALTARVKPVVVSMGTVAASGGYYVAAPATRIFANPLTITGSIGVFYGKADVSGLLRKIGVNVEVYKTSPRADVESFFRPFTPEERIELQHKVGQFYATFVSRVSEGRKLSASAVDRVGQGRVWTGEQAKQNGLVDELGGLRQALASARKLGGLPADAPIVELPKIPTSLIGQLLGIEGIRSGTDLAAALPPPVAEIARAMAPFVVHAGDKPLARMELTAVEP